MTQCQAKKVEGSAYYECDQMHTEWLLKSQHDDECPGRHPDPNEPIGEAPT